MIDSSILRIGERDRVKVQVRNLTVAVKKKAATRKKQQRRRRQSPQQLDGGGKQDIEEIGSREGDGGGKEHKILEDVSFDLGQGELMAIMGGSGSGKTTLLNTLSQRLNVNTKSLEFGGQVLYFVGDEAVGQRRVKNAYLLQSDIFLPGLTVFETLQYQADLRLPPAATSQEKTELIESLLETLELQAVRDQRVMSFVNYTTHLSGGEQRRVSLAIQLLSKPSILFLDEPTTGLDTSSSLKLIQVLNKLASPEFGVTIILSIHQPRPEITILFDKVCMLTKGGRVVYFGSLLQANDYSYTVRDTLGTLADVNTSNALDYIMRLSVKDSSTRDTEELSIQRVNKLVESWKAYTASMYDTVTLSPKETRKQFELNIKLFSKNREDKISLAREIYVLTKRTFLLTWRDKITLLAVDGGVLFLAVTCGWLFYKPTPDLAGIRSITSVLYVCLEVVGFAFAFLEVNRLWFIDGIFFFREYKENYVSIFGFIASRRLGKFFLEDLPVPLIFTVIVYFMWGLRVDGAAYFFKFFITAFLIYNLGSAAATLCFAIMPDVAMSTLVLNISYQLQNSACGYFVNAATMPVYVRWVKYISYFWYAFGALTANQYTGWMGQCPYDSGDSRCDQYSGETQLSILGYPTGWVGEPIGILCAWLVGLYIFICIGLKFKNMDLSVAKTIENKIGGDEETHFQEEDDSLSEVEKKQLPPNNSPFEQINKIISQEEVKDDIDINLTNINLSVKVKDRKFQFIPISSDQRTLLSNVTANFKANQVNVIMGPSGSGKTTLLNFMSNRLSQSSSYKSSGEIKLNDTQIVTPKSMSKISAYVTQHFNSLIPTLTVRETLYYQAILRLPRETHQYIPGVISSILRIMELVDCADTVIGSEYVKGVSGGEKRRVTIAMQLLSRPKILFLDEPTSGLDSATSVAILNLLDTLAKKYGTTIVTTIHQPSADMFRKFGRLLLLAKGGRVVYNGNSWSVGNYLDSIGHRVPNNINIADYILDIISENIDEDREVTMARVNSLVGKWESEKAQDHPAFSIHKELIDLDKYKSYNNGFLSALPTIAKRQLVNSLRTKDVLISRMGQTIALGIIHSLFFAPMKNTQDGITNRLGLVQEVLNLYFIGLVNNISLFPTERNLFYDEYQDGIYGLFDFMGSYLLNELPTEILPSFFFSAMVVFVCGLPRNASMFFSMALSSFVITNCGESLGIMVNSIFNHMGLAINSLAGLMTIAIFMGGTMSLHMPEFFKAWNYLSPLKYAVGICAKLGFQDQTFTCETLGCTLNSGAKVIEYYHLDCYLNGYFGALVACMVIYRIVATGLLYLRIKFFL